MKKILSSLLSLVILSLGLVFFTSTPASAGNEPIEFCHALGNGKYHLMSEVADEGIINGHTGTNHQNGADIIPKFTYIKDKTIEYFDGQNLDKEYLIKKGCKEDAVPVGVEVPAPSYEQPTCPNPSNEMWGRVTEPAVGDGVTESPAVLTVRPDGTAVWTKAYSLKESDEDFAYSWKDGNPERTISYTFNAVNISEDDLWIIDSKTGKGHCELSNTGLAGIDTNTLVLAGGLIFAGMIFLGVTNFIGRRRNA